MKELGKYRAEIDSIDGKILLLLKKRFAVIEKIGAAKARLRAPVRDSRRMKELYGRRMKIAARYKLPKKLIKDIYSGIVAHSMKREEKYRR